MGKSVEDEGRYRACGECTRVCQTTHGEGLPRSVPRFSRPVLDYALPSATDCNMVSDFDFDSFAALLLFGSCNRLYEGRKHQCVDGNTPAISVADVL